MGISEYPDYTLGYAKEVTLERVVELESDIARTSLAKSYCDKCIHLFDEKAAGLHPYFAYRYAKDVVKGKLQPRLHQKMQLWAMSNEHKGNRYLQRYLTSKKYQ
jgi:hypothetical protein